MSKGKGNNKENDKNDTTTILVDNGKKVEGNKSSHHKKVIVKIAQNKNGTEKNVVPKNMIKEESDDIDQSDDGLDARDFDESSEEKDVVPAKVIKQDVKKVEPVKDIIKIIEITAPAILLEMNKRIKALNECSVHIRNVGYFVKPKSIKDLLIKAVDVTIPIKMKGEKNCGYGFVRFANAEDAAEGLAILKKATVDGRLLVAAPYSYCKVVDVINHVDFNKVILTSFVNQDILGDIQAHFSTDATATAINAVTYELIFAKKGDALALFNQNNTCVNGRTLQVNLFYSDTQVFDNSILPTPSATSKSEVVKVKAGTKRISADSDEEVKIKKIKIEELRNEGKKAAVEKEEPMKTVKKQKSRKQSKVEE